MNIIALDTSTESCSAALLYQDQLFTRVEMTQRGHSELILAMMDDLFKQAKASISDIEALAFGRGPGSFTGIRVGVGVAQGIAFARNIPVIAISSLASLAQHVADTLQADYIAVAMDARMGEIYCANYRCIDGIVTLLDKEQVCPPEKFIPISDQEWLGVGTGWSIYNEILRQNFANKLSNIQSAHYPNASSVITLAQIDIKAGRLLSAEQALPVYLRDNVAKKQGQQ